MTQLAHAHIEDETVPRSRLRPLPVLITLIRADLQRGRIAAQKASMKHFRAAGAKLLEAKEQVPYGEWIDWLNTNFHLSLNQARLYMRVAKKWKKKRARFFSSISEFIRNDGQPNYNQPSPLNDEIKEIIDQLDTDTLNQKRDALKRAEEREAQRVLALQLIDIGYKVLAKKLHPDKPTGSRDAMTRLNAVRDRLRQAA
jgi:hypothetical protein